MLSVECLGTLLEVARKESLEVEVRKLLLWIRDLLLVVVEELLELVIRKDEATVGLVLEIIRTNVGSDLLGHIRTSHQGTCLLAKESSQIIADLGRLYEATGRTVALVLVATSIHLVKHAHLAGDLLLDLSHLTLEK